VSDRDGSPHIYLANDDGSAATRLTEGTDPTWSGDRRRLAFTRSGAIYVINVDGSGLRTLAEGGGPAWSPDGTRIAYGNDRTGLVVIDADGSNTTVLIPPDPDWGHHFPAWSPDGRTIAYVRTSFYDPWELNVINVDRSGARRLVDTDASEPAWSPDGAHVAFSHRAGIAIANADGSGWRLQVPGNVFGPEWTADGRLLYHKPTSSSSLGQFRIFVRDGASERQLIPEATAPTLPNYSDRRAVWAR
jgi:Tol biopolymer transport system component